MAKKNTPTLPPVTMTGVRLVYRNLAGREGPYNKAGDKHFSVLLPWDVAEAMAKDGYNVKFPKDDEDKTILPHLQVKVNYDSERPPRIYQITSRGRSELSEDTCAVIDYADILNVDLIINPYQWTVNGKDGVSAYLKSMYVTIEEDELELKYADIEDVAARNGEEE